MTAKSLNAQAAYDHWHASLGVDSIAEDPWYQLVKKHLNPATDLNDARVLEIGCGRGGFACWLAQQPVRPREIIAADFSPTAIEKGRAFAIAQNISGVTWEVNDIQAISHPANTFDTVISCETIEHVPAPRQALHELARVLKPGGRFLLTVPNYFGILGLYRIYLQLFRRPYQEIGQPINNFTTLPQICSWVAHTGLRIISVDAIGHYFPFPGRPALRISWLDRPRVFTKWFALHSLIVAVKVS
jgi:ubiquinone/menaquinone biosynthesis C-methylase UbiE